MIMASNIALDTNVLIYLHDNSNPIKREIAKNLLAENPYIPSQVISEYLNTARRLLNISKDELLVQTAGLLSGCQIVPILPATLAFAASLIKKYQFQLFDAVVVAAAIEGNCKILYSEDMHHSLVVEKSLTIINPFHKSGTSML
jgi:predicted nucleic acid-binding protein